MHGDCGGEMSYIFVEAKKYRVIETLPYHNVGMKAKVIATPAGEKVVVSGGGNWRFWTSQDRLSLGPSRIIGQKLERK